MLLIANTLFAQNKQPTWVNNTPKSETGKFVYVTGVGTHAVTDTAQRLAFYNMIAT